MSIKIKQSLQVQMLFLAALPLTGQIAHHLELDSVTGQGKDAIRITYAEGNGIRINSAGLDGVYVTRAGSNGVRVGVAGYTGVSVTHAGAHGVSVSHAEGNGVYVGSAGGYSMNIRGDKNAATLTGHIGLIKNENNGTNADVLALQVGTTGNPGGANNFITFYNGAGAVQGEVQGNGNGGISYTSGGSDYAEYLPVIDRSETFSPGDIVGVHSGHISKHTKGADQVLVITDQAAVIGNKPMVAKDDTEMKGYETVSFIGQVRVRVRGKVQAGDWIVASGHHDGIGMAVTSKDIALYHQIAGRAWESSSDVGIKRINTVVGLDQSTAYMHLIRSQETRIKAQNNALRRLESRIAVLEEKKASENNRHSED